MRLTETMRMTAVNIAESRASSELYKATRRASSGMRVESPSDDPTAYAVTLDYQGAIDRLSSRVDVLGHASDTLDIAEGALSSAGDLLSRARELAVQMANGDMDAVARTRAGKEIHEIREELLGLANTKGPDRYLFAGTANGTPPFTATGAFVGNDNPIMIELADGVLTAANASGAKAFTAAGGRDVLEDLSDLEGFLNANDLTGIRASIDNLEAGQAQVVSARAQVGLTTNRLRDASTVAAATITTLHATKARASEADVLEAYSRLAETKSAYERSIQVTAQILQITGIQR